MNKSKKIHNKKGINSDVGRNLWIGDIHGSACAIYGSILCAEIHGLRAQISVDRATRSMNFAYDTILLAQTYMDGLVISTNLKLNNFTHFNGPLQSTEQNHRPSERLHGRRSRQVPAVILLLFRTSASHRIRGE